MNPLKFLDESQVRNTNGELTMVFRGDYRASSIENGFKIQNSETDSGSGGLYFTESSDIASGYAKTKEFYAEDTCETEKHIKVTTKLGMELPLTSVEMMLNKQQKNRIVETVLSMDSDEGFTGVDTILSKNTWDDYLARNNGNYIKSCTDILFSSGLIGSDMFVEFWRETGVFSNVKYANPYDSEGAVTPVYLDIKKPFDTSKITMKFIDQLKEEIGSSDETLSYIEEAFEKGCGETICVVTTPCREALLKLGYDGIKDNGGHITGHGPHVVWIALKDNQVMPAYSTEAINYRLNTNTSTPSTFSP